MGLRTPAANTARTMNHYTDRISYNSIRSQLTWVFQASQPPGNHPKGTYFTTLDPQEPNLANKLRIPRSKLGCIFVFGGNDGLVPLPGGRGQYIFYTTDDYRVEKDRQTRCGETGL